MAANMGKETKSARLRRLDKKWRNGTATRAEIMEVHRELRRTGIK